MSDDEKMRGAIVEIVDPEAKDGMPLLQRRVYVNGTFVGFTQGVHVDVGGRDEPTTVHLTLVPSQVIIRGAEQ